ncbi:MAG: hypothetical protein L0Z62_38050 [Gemmataceae bacterium]|nr:hypothetical protein [Gemmataceae bacterium]
MVSAPAGRLVQFALDPLELLRVDDGLVAAVPVGLAPLDAADVDGVAQDADHLLLAERLAAARLARTGLARRHQDAELLQAALDRAGRAQFLEGVEEVPADDLGPLRVDEQLALVVRVRPVAVHVAAVPQAALDPVLHDGDGPLGGHLALELGEDHDEPDHGLAHRRGGVEVLAEADDVDLVLGEQVPQLDEIEQGAR